MSPYRLDYAWCTDKGRVRVGNEDAVSVLPSMGLVVVADGIGGASAGEVASRLAADVIGEHFRSHSFPLSDRREALRLLQAAVLVANRAIWQSAQRSALYSGMGTTVVVGCVGADWLVFAHVGDSRLYRLRGPELTQLTRDHSLIQESVDQGHFPTMEDARNYGINEHILTRSLGTPGAIAADTGDTDLRPGDLFLFCTDGLTGMLTDEELRRALLAPGQDLEGHAAGLVDLANRSGGLDNTTVALVRVSSQGVS